MGGFVAVTYFFVPFKSSNIFIWLDYKQKRNYKTRLWIFSSRFNLHPVYTYPGSVFNVYPANLLILELTLREGHLPHAEGNTSPTVVQYTEMWPSLIAINPSLYEYLQNFDAINKTNALDNGRLTVHNRVTRRAELTTHPRRWIFMKHLKSSLLPCRFCF
jgi:hypothetical protein